MAFISWKDISYAIIGGVDIRATIAALGIEQHAVKDSFQPAGEVFPTNIDTGMRNGSLSMSTKLNSTATDALAALNGTAQVVMILDEGNTLPAHFHGFQGALIADTDVKTDPGQVHDLTPGFAVSGALSYGTLVAPLAARTTAGDTKGAYADLGVASIPNGLAYIETTAITLGAASSVTVNVCHSTDHITFPVHTAFTNVSAIGAECKALATTVNEYLAISWTWNGGAGTSFTAAVGVAPN
jgi:hypothetical protein